MAEKIEAHENCVQKNDDDVEKLSSKIFINFHTIYEFRFLLFACVCVCVSSFFSFILQRCGDVRCSRCSLFKSETIICYLRVARTKFIRTINA